MAAVELDSPTPKGNRIIAADQSYDSASASEAEDLHEARREAAQVRRDAAEDAYLARGEAEKAAIKARDEEGAKRPLVAER